MSMMDKIKQMLKGHETQAGQGVDARPHGRRDDEREKEEGDDELQLPKRDRHRNHEHDDERRDEGSLRGLSHSASVLAQMVAR